jgi:Protein of unknown function (DUF3089)
VKRRVVQRSVRRYAALVVVAALVAWSASVSTAAADTVWLCKPGLADNPCLDDLTTTVVKPSGATRVERSRPARRPRIDCFYVYPTVSSQIAVNATLAIDPEIRAIAVNQASRFSQLCRVFAPVYRQLTLVSIAGGATPEAREIAYGDVRAAWHDYLANHNHGRKVVLVGHSQGTGWLTRLIGEEIDPDRGLRRKLVSALLLGGRVTVPIGRDVGGDFQHIPACRRPGQTGCVVAYNSYDETPPPDSRFGRDRDGLQILCTNPARLTGGTGNLKPYFTTSRFPGILGGIIGDPPVAPTPWVKFPRLYTAECRRAAGATWLHVTDVGPPGDTRYRVAPAPDATWGLHIPDLNLAWGNLLRVVERQLDD